MVYATGIHPKWETPNDGYGGKCHYNAEWRGALDSANAKLKKENAELKADRDSYKREMERLGDRVIETQDFGLAEIKKLVEENGKLKEDITELKNYRGGRFFDKRQDSANIKLIEENMNMRKDIVKLKDDLFNITQILANENGYAKKLLEDRNKLKAEKDSFEKNFDYVVGDLKTEIDSLEAENSFLTGKVESLHRVVDNRDRFIHKIQDENTNLHSTIGALDKKIEDLRLANNTPINNEVILKILHQLDGDTSIIETHINSLYRTIDRLKKERDNAFRVLDLRDERIKQLETRELELAEKVDGRNLPPQDSVADNVGQLFDIGPKGKPVYETEIVVLKAAIQEIQTKLATIEVGATR